VKLVVVEPESEALRRYLRQRTTRVSSALARVEVVRAVRFEGDDARTRARSVLGRIRLLAIDEPLLEAAADVDQGVLRSLDAIHLASAQAFGISLEALVTYDSRMILAAEEVGLPWSSPS
jgi:predicted nucleic acid-binding protein